MAKVYSGAGKYLIKASFVIEGVVDKPDIIGAIFGQSEGLLGEQMDLKELQKSGKIGRIEVRHKTEKGKTKGELDLSSSMDMAETSLLAAAIEAVDKVGPCESEFAVQKIEDIRSEKRKFVTERAEELLKRFVKEEMPETMTLAEDLRGAVKKAGLSYYGREKIPCGPDLEGEEIVVVEGRADVLNLLKNNVRNAIAMDGAKIASSLLGLCRKKKVTVFIDGDRGGELNARKLIALTRVDYVAKAPEGKEVEELTSKELHTALKKRVPAKEAFPFREYKRGKTFESRPRESQGYERRPRESRPREFRPRESRAPRETRGYGERRFTPKYLEDRPRQSRSYERRPREARGPREFRPRESRPYEPRRPERPIISYISGEEYKPFEKAVKAVKEKKKARMLSEKNRKLKDCNVRDLFECLEKVKKPFTIVFDGIITKRLAEKAIEKGVKTMIGLKVDAKPREVKDLKIGLIK